MSEWRGPFDANTYEALQAGGFDNMHMHSSC